jgi:hypothetical protein
MTTYCGHTHTVGHGEGATCGKQFYSSIYQCHSCLTADLTRLRNCHVTAGIALDALIAGYGVSETPVQLSELKAIRTLLQG